MFERLVESIDQRALITRSAATGSSSASTRISVTHNSTEAMYSWLPYSGPDSRTLSGTSLEHRAPLHQQRQIRHLHWTKTELKTKTQFQTFTSECAKNLLRKLLLKVACHTQIDCHHNELLPLAVCLTALVVTPSRRLCENVWRIGFKHDWLLDFSDSRLRLKKEGWEVGSNAVAACLKQRRERLVWVMNDMKQCKLRGTGRLEDAVGLQGFISIPLGPLLVSTQSELCTSKHRLLLSLWPRTCLQKLCVQIHIYTHTHTY